MADAALPKSLIVLKRYSARALTADLIAGITVGLVASAARDGVRHLVRRAAAGRLYCAIVAGFLISALGGSRFQIGGPTGAFVVVVAGIVATLRPRRPVHVHDDGGRAC